MKDSIFCLNKQEQRIVVVIVLVLVVVAFAKYFYEMRSHTFSPTPSIISEPAVPSPSPVEEERTKPNED
jgi:hypothetical protein